MFDLARWHAFRGAIVEEPADDGIRLILADAMDEQDDPHGQFIRLQIELATGRASRNVDDSSLLWCGVSVSV